MAPAGQAPDYDTTPAISFDKLRHGTQVKNGVREDSITFTIKYKDGDADLGLGYTISDSQNSDEQFPQDFLPPFDGDTMTVIENGTPVKIINPNHFNWWLEIYRKENGAFKLYQIPTFSAGQVRLNFFGRFPRLIRDERKEPIDGDISYRMAITQVPFPGSLHEGDTLYFTIQIQDRALNKSNIVKSPEVILGKI